jgi:hypothetical protein
MPISSKVQEAWRSCDFCSQLDDAIAAIIIDRQRWKELPLGFVCAWKRISQVAFRRQLQMRKGLWSALCSVRADVNNQPGGPWEQSDWTEDWCPVYRAQNPDH